MASTNDAKRCKAISGSYLRQKVVFRIASVEF